MKKISQIALEAIANLDLTYYVKKAIRSGGINEEQASIAAMEYRHFLCLVYIKIDNGIKEFVVPSKRADEIWHQHILDTQSYSSFCEESIGQYLHHNPHLDEGSDPFNVAVKHTQDLHLIYGHLGFVDVYLDIRCRNSSRSRLDDSNAPTTTLVAADCGGLGDGSSSGSSCGSGCGAGCGG